MVIKEAIVSALRNLELRFLRDPDDGGFVIPVSVENDHALILVDADDQEREVMIRARVCEVPAGRRAATALLLGELNSRFKLITFAMPRLSAVWIDTIVDLTLCSNAEAAIAAGLARFSRVLARTCADIRAAAADASPLPGRLQLEITEILEASEEPPDGEPHLV